MGGPVALTFLRLFPAKTKGLVLVDAFIPQPPKDGPLSALQPGMLSTVPFAGIAGAPGLDFPQGLPGKLNPWKWERPLPSGGPVWTDRFSDLIRAIHW